MWVTEDAAGEAIRTAEGIRAIVLDLLGLDPASWCGARAAESEWTAREGEGEGAP